MRSGWKMIGLIQLVLAVYTLAGQDRIAPDLIISGVFLGESAPLRELPVITEEEWRLKYSRSEYKRLNPTLANREYPFAETALPKGPDQAWQRMMGPNRETRAPLQNWTGTDCPYFPPDANGTIGPNHYMHTINTVYTIYNRAGNIVAGPTDLNKLFYNMAGALYNDGDPIVLYDEQADRWLISEFSITGANDYMLIAVSTTNDPTGTWYKYSFDVADKPDYEKLGIWQDGYYMGTNTYNNADIYVFQRSQMLQGLAALAIGWDNPWRPGPALNFNCVPPLDNDGVFAPEGEPGLFISFNDDAVGGGSDELWIYELDVDWVTPANSSFARTQQITVTAFDSNFGTDLSNIKQPGTATELDAIPQVIMNPPQYRNFGEYETIVCCHSVDVDNTDHAGIRWYELRRVASGNWTVRQEGTYAPDGHSRWMGSIMLNGAGEIGLGYSVSSATVYPSIRYCGQSGSAYLAGNSLLDIAEDVIQAGTASQSAAARWGDYSSLQIDPTDDETFWYTNQYVGPSGERKTRIANFQIGPVILTANFAASNVNPQLYSIVTLTDVSFGNPTSWAWVITPATFNFIGGTSESSQHPQVQFTAPGAYSIRLTIQNGGNNDMEFKSGYIQVADCGNLYLPFNEDFSDGVQPSCWKNIDNVGNGHLWLFNNPGNRPVATPTGGNGIAIMDSYYFGIAYPQNADLITPTLDLSAYTTVNLYFQHFFPYYTPNGTSASGKLFYSINDGNSWTQLQSWNNSSNPAIYNQDLSTQTAGQSKVRFRWNYTGFGYYWAIDDLSITGTGPVTWTGATSSGWTVGTNWSTGSAPGPASHVIIPASAPNWPAFTGDLTIGTTCDKITMYGASQLNITGSLIIAANKTLQFMGTGQVNITGNLTNSGSIIPGAGTISFTGSNASKIITSTTSNLITNYQRTTFAKGMTQLSGATAGPSGDNVGANINLGFTFNYLGVAYTSARMCTNGWLTLNQSGTTSSTNANLFTSTAPQTTLAPWFDDLTADGTTGVLSYATEGTAPNRVFTAEWKNVPTFRTNATARISFQVKLYESSNIIEFHYGTLTAGTHNGSESASAGIENATGGPGHFIEATTGSTTTGISNLVSTTQWPAVNYRFSPPYSSQNLYHLTINKTGAGLEILQNLTLKGNLNVVSGTFSGPYASNGILNITGNWTNNGNFLTIPPTVVLNGTSPQTIGGTSATAFNNLTVNNNAGIVLGNNITSSGTLTLLNGTINTGAYTLELGTSPTSVGTLAWTGGCIIGPFKRWIAASTTSPLDFPVGTSSTVNNARVTFSNNTGGSLTVRFEPGNPGNNSGFPLSENGMTLYENGMYMEGTWSVIPATLTSTNYALELSGNGFSTVGAPEAAVRIIKRPDAGGAWILNGTHLDCTGNTARRTGLSGFSRFALAKPCNRKISGNITYYNQANTPITSGVTLKLFSNGSQVGSDLPVTSGTYEFPGLCPGNYEIRAFSSIPTTGSINTTDAAQVNYWSANPYQVEKVRFYAGDVTGAAYFINSTDALRIQNHFVNGTAFDKGNWVFWRAGETISGNDNPTGQYPAFEVSSADISANIYAMCAGDFNRSFLPGAARSANDLQLANGIGTLAGPGESLELPFAMVKAATIGAFSLILMFPADLALIEEVAIPGHSGYLDWAINKNELRISWFTSNPVYLADHDILLKIRIKTTEQFTDGKTIRFILADDVLNEISDKDYEKIENVTLQVNEIISTSFGIDDHDNAGKIGLSCYPNPGKDIITISYFLPDNGKVSLEVSNIYGIKFPVISDEMKPSGFHEIKFNATSLPAGFYIVSLNFKNNDTQLNNLKKLIIEK